MFEQDELESFSRTAINIARKHPDNFWICCSKGRSNLTHGHLTDDNGKLDHNLMGMEFTIARAVVMNDRIRVLEQQHSELQLKLDVLLDMKRMGQLDAVHNNKRRRRDSL
jgi:hypothetical protein